MHKGKQAEKSQTSKQRQTDIDFFVIHDFLHQQLKLATRRLGMGLHCGFSLGKCFGGQSALPMLLRIVTTIEKSAWRQRSRGGPRQQQIFVERSASVLLIARLGLWKRDIESASSVNNRPTSEKFAFA